MHAYRSHTCAELALSDVGTEVRLSGWVHRVRDHGGVLFIDLRDHYGITQVLADSESPAFAGLEGVRAEWVIRIDGTVKARAAELVNPKLPTGEVEVYVRAVRCSAPRRSFRCRCSGRSTIPRRRGSSTASSTCGGRGCTPISCCGAR